ncbi:SgcJ/EcaC family oxidoreductase [Antrihabitans cavernicola]|nr:SgcJ/EcaC family oxidoreductase [Spelaeibacter cavernicola]
MASNAITEDTAVLDVLAEVYQAWADNDADAFTSHYTTDATAVMPGTFHADRDAIHSYMAAAFAGPMKGTRAIDTPLSVRVVGNMAIVVSDSDIVAADASDLADARKARATWVLVKQDDRWLITAYANCAR